MLYNRPSPVPPHFPQVAGAFPEPLHVLHVQFPVFAPWQAEHVVTRVPWPPQRGHWRMRGARRGMVLFYNRSKMVKVLLATFLNENYRVRVWLLKLSSVVSLSKILLNDVFHYQELIGVWNNPSWPEACL